ncbi:autotransporter outer membrane beta-barrel domain-containing protein, partial [Pseudomonas sp. NPDC087342]
MRSLFLFFNQYRWSHWLVLSPVLVISSPGLAVTIVGPGQTLNIAGTTAPDNYLVRNGGVLRANSAQTFEISVESGSTLEAVGGTYAGRNRARGITVTNSQATLTDIIVSGGVSGLTFNRQGTSVTGSTGRVTGSIVSGDSAGISLSGMSSVELIDTRVTANLADSVGLQFFGGDLRASQNTIISGGENGVRMDEDSARLGISRLVLDASSVEGRAGSAIVVDQGIEATIQVQNNSTLLSGNGILLDVLDASTANLFVASSTLEGNVQVAGNSTVNLTLDQARLTGDVLAGSGSSANVVLQNQSVLEGNVRLTGATGEVTLDQSTMTGDVLADSGSSANVVLQDQSVLEGNVHLTGATGEVTLDQSTMTGDVLADNGSSANVVLQDQSVLEGNVHLTGATGEVTLDQ